MVRSCYHVSINIIGVSVLTERADDGNPLLLTIAHGPTCLSYGIYVGVQVEPPVPSAIVSERAAVKTVLPHVPTTTTEYRLPPIGTPVSSVRKLGSTANHTMPSKHGSVFGSTTADEVNTEVTEVFYQTEFRALRRLWGKSPEINFSGHDGAERNHGEAAAGVHGGARADWSQHCRGP